MNLVKKVSRLGQMKWVKKRNQWWDEWNEIIEIRAGTDEMRKEEKSRMGQMNWVKKRNKGWDVWIE